MHAFLTLTSMSIAYVSLCWLVSRNDTVEWVECVGCIEEHLMDEVLEELLPLQLFLFLVTAILGVI